uniref:ZU5 domain-containing protein n=1 Tax=Mesocestoides corti TaxID=53468 RepID=A0A5K3G378_MESCO
ISPPLRSRTLPAEELEFQPQGPETLEPQNCAADAESLWTVVEKVASVTTRQGPSPSRDTVEVDIEADRKWMTGLPLEHTDDVAEDEHKAAVRPGSKCVSTGGQGAALWSAKSGGWRKGRRREEEEGTIKPVTVSLCGVREATWGEAQPLPPSPGSSVPTIVPVLTPRLGEREETWGKPQQD